MFTVRVPFAVPKSIRIGDEEATASQGLITYMLKGDGYLHVLRAEGFPTESAAADFLARARSALAWLLLSSSVPTVAQLAPQEIRYNDDPVAEGERYARATRGKLTGPVDAFIHGPEAAIYPSGKRLRVETALPVSVLTSVPSFKALSTLIEGAAFPESPSLSQDGKLVVALDLYGAHFTENSDSARFLTLVMVLEALASATLRPPPVLRLLERWSSEVQMLIEEPTTPAEDAAALQALKDDLRHRKEESIGSQIKSLVLSSLGSATDAGERAKEARDLYNLRSRLVHGGALKPAVVAKGVTQARVLVERILRSRYLQAVGASGR